MYSTSRSTLYGYLASQWDGSLSGARYDDVLYLRVFGWQQAAAAIGGQLNALQMQEAPAGEENQRQPLS